MSDINNQDILDVVKSSITDTVATKAEKAEVEALKSQVEALEVPSIEGLVKSEEVSSISEELEATKGALEELKAKFDSAPAIHTKQEKKVSDIITFDNYEGFKGNLNMDLSGEFQKSFGGTGSSAQVTGSMTATQRLYYQMQQKNPFRAVSTIMPTSAGSVNLPQVTSITAGVEGTITNSSGQFSTAGGGITTTNVIPQNWVSRVAYSDQALEDLPGLDQQVAGFMAQAIARAEASNQVSNLNSATIAEVNTGAATALPTDIGPWTDLMAELDSAYKPNAKWMMSRAAYAHLRSTNQGGNGSDLLFNPMTGVPTFLGYDIIINDHLQDGDTAGDNAVYFGDFSAGTIIVSRKEMNISRHEDTHPGAMYYYGNMRTVGTVWDANALVRFNTAA